ncbi:phage tail protein [Cohnella zeiphila]|uniref:Phage tail protein n=1 Tax=Cohnella zeiphila TaxID=2761120 RepID=A0A7X0SQT2_9BACL|nr:tail fiber protein [Cohnella zeiphila]MBB6734246.1 phage tail protein [Cohnella zeiphila]
MDPYIGEIRLFAGDYAPSGWALCNGQQLNVVGNQALFTIIGTTYGGDGKTVFNLPDMQNRVPIHWGPGNGLTPRNLGKAGGDATATLTMDQMPVHSHTPNAQSVADSESPTGAVWAATPRSGKKPGPDAYSATPSVPMNPIALNAVGGNQSHNNMQPYVALHFIIALEGVYPLKA